MLQIITNGETTDLYPDIELSLVIENPMFSSDGIPVPFSFSYDLPLSVRNRKIFQYIDRSTSSKAFPKLPTVILFDGLEVASGEQTIEEVTDRISVNFNGSIIPDHVQKMLYRQPLGGIELGKASTLDDGYDSTIPRRKLNEILINNLTDPEANIIAGPVGIKIDSNPAQEDYLRKRLTFVNFYDGLSNGFMGPIYRRSPYISKILPSFRVGWLMDMLLDHRVEKNIFNETDWQRLVLMSKWHPKYQTTNNDPVFDVDDNLNVRISLADFMPQKPANEFITDILKLPCASLFAKGDHYAIEFNKDIIARSVVHDWTDKMMGVPTISEQKGMKYVCGYSTDYDDVPSEAILFEVNKVSYIAEFLSTNTADSDIFYIRSTGQIIERIVDDSPAGYHFNVLRQTMNEPVINDPEDDRSSVDMTFPGCVLKTTVCQVNATDDQNIGNRWYFMPEGEAIEKERTDDLIVGLYHGLVDQIQWRQPQAAKYPYISHCNYDCHGNRIGSLSLSFVGEDGLMKKYHQPFKEWVEKNKRVLKCEIKLSAIDLHNLDIRDKFRISYKLYFIQKLTVTFRLFSINPAEVEFIEV